MRTTVTIDDDVLLAARELADQQRRTIGGVISDLARQSLRSQPASDTRNGIRLLPRRGGPPVTLTMVNALRDELP